MITPEQRQNIELFLYTAESLKLGDIAQDIEPKQIRGSELSLTEIKFRIALSRRLESISKEVDSLKEFMRGI